MKTNMEEDTFRLQSSLAKRIKTLADKIGLSPDEIVGLAVEGYLQQNGIESPRGRVDADKSVDAGVIKDLREQGYSFRQISKMTNVPTSTIHKMLKNA